VLIGEAGPAADDEAGPVSGDLHHACAAEVGRYDKGGVVGGPLQYVAAGSRRGVRVMAEATGHVGGLIADFQRRATRERVAYLCPTKQLARHVFNSNPALHDVQTLVLDDAHAAESYVAKPWSLTLQRDDAAYHDVVSALAPALDPAGGAAPACRDAGLGAGRHGPSRGAGSGSQKGAPSNSSTPPAPAPVLTLLATPPQHRDLDLADAIYETVMRSILTDLPTLPADSAAAAAVAFRAVAPKLPMLTHAERALLSEWLDRAGDGPATPGASAGSG
jgi:hypothetical protein